jgi:hypothetical protein
MENEKNGDIVTRYRTLAELHGVYKESADYLKANSVHKELTLLSNQIVRLGDVSISTLKLLLGDPNPWVRLWTSVSLRDYYPDIAERTLNKLVIDDEGLTGIEAGMILDIWEQDRSRAINKHDSSDNSASKGKL